MKIFYRQFNHTSDLGIEVRGRDLEALFQNAALCLTDLITDLEKVGGEIHRLIEVQGENSELLLREFLAELLYLFHTENFLPGKVIFTKINETGLKAELAGEMIFPDMRPVYREIKSVTYHQLKVEQSESGYIARFVLDI